MGIDAALRDDLLTWCPAANVNGPLPGHFECKEGGVVINDISTSTRGTINPTFPVFDIANMKYSKIHTHCKCQSKCKCRSKAKDGCKCRNGCRCAESECRYFFSGHEFYNMIMDGVKKTLEDGSTNVTTYVLCLDQARFVPPEKYQEQERRKLAAAQNPDRQEPYATEFLVNDRGICDTRTGVYERFDLRRLMDNHELRRKLWDFVARKLPNDTFPEGTTVILDHYLEGALVLNHELREYVKEHRHDVGEGEMMALYWARVFHDRPCTVITTDTDMIPLTLSYLSHCQMPRPYPFYWSFDKGKTFVDMSTMHAALHQQTPWNTMTFMTYSILRGSDYFEKTSVLRYISNKAIESGVLLAYQRNPQLFCECLHNHVAFRWLIITIYNVFLRNHMDKDNEKAKSVIKDQKINAALAKRNAKSKSKKEIVISEYKPLYVLPTLKAIRDYINRKNLARHLVPSDTDIKEIHKVFNFNVRYWCRDMQAVPVGLARTGISPSAKGEWRSVAPISCDHPMALKLLQSIARMEKAEEEISDEDMLAAVEQTPAVDIFMEE